MKKILFVIDVDEKTKEKIQTLDAEISFMDKKDVTPEVINQVDAVVGNLPVNLLNQSQSLKWVHLESAGADRYTTLNSNIMLTNSTGAYGKAIAEHMIASVFYFYKKIREYAKNQVQHQWNNLGKVDCVQEATVLVLGYGDIGQEFARIMKAMGCTILAVKRTMSDVPYADEVFTIDQIKEALPKADIIAMSLPATDATKNLMNEELLRLCKKKAVLINVGRGSTLDTDALIRVLDEGWFKGVSLDVTNPEPLPINHPLWRYENVLITPHISGNYNMQATYDKVIEIALKNIEHYIHDETLLNEVDRKTGYKKSN